MYNSKRENVIKLLFLVLMTIHLKIGQVKIPSVRKMNGEGLWIDYSPELTIKYGQDTNILFYE